MTTTEPSAGALEAAAQVFICVMDRDTRRNFAFALDRFASEQNNAAYRGIEDAAEWHNREESRLRAIAETDRLHGRQAHCGEVTNLAEEHKRSSVSIRALAALPPAPETMDYVDIVFDGPPGHEPGRFVEVEDPAGKSISLGAWLRRPDGYWVLRIPRVNLHFGEIATVAGPGVITGAAPQMPTGQTVHASVGVQTGPLASVEAFVRLVEEAREAPHDCAFNQFEDDKLAEIIRRARALGKP